MSVAAIGSAKARVLPEPVGGVPGHVVAIKDVGDGRSLDGQGVLYAPLVQDLHKPVWQSEFVEASCGLVDAREGSGQLLTPFP